MPVPALPVDHPAPYAPLPQVLVTPHSAFLTEEALANIAATTVDNIAAWAAGRPLANEVLPASPKPAGD